MQVRIITCLLASVLALQAVATHAESTAPTGYALGTQFADNVITVLGADKIVPGDFLAGVRDTLSDTRQRLSSAEMSALLRDYSQKLQDGKAKAPKAGADLSYALGVTLSRDVSIDKQELDLDAFIEGASDVLNGKQLKYGEAEIISLVEAYFKRWLEQRRQRAEQNLAAGRAYLQRNRNRDGVKELDNGLQYEILRSGDGEHPAPQSRVRVHYRGTAIDGAEFDSSHRTGAPVSFSLQGVIRGWQEVLPLMRTGAKWRVHVPPELAYGERGSPPAIGPNETLVFDIELLEIL